MMTKGQVARFFIPFSMAVCMVILSSTRTVAQSDVLGKGQDSILNIKAVQLEKKNREEFKKWRLSIPDYERRLYERVKRLKKDNLRLLRIVLVGFALVFTVFVVGFFFVIRRIKEASAVEGSHLKEEGRISESVSREKTKNILQMQKALANAIADLKPYLEDFRDNERKLSQMIESTEAHVDRLDREIDILVRSSGDETTSR